jgi:hypothetical protein
MKSTSLRRSYPTRASHVCLRAPPDYDVLLTCAITPMYVRRLEIPVCGLGKAFRQPIGTGDGSGVSIDYNNAVVTGAGM